MTYEVVPDFMSFVNCLAFDMMERGLTIDVVIGEHMSVIEGRFGKWERSKILSDASKNMEQLKREVRKKVKTLEAENVQRMVTSLPSEKLYLYPSVLAFKHPLTNELIVLKNQHNENVQENELEFFSIFEGNEERYQKLKEKRVLIDWFSMRKTGYQALFSS